MTSMRAIRVRQTGGPEAMVLESIELPRPGPGEIQVRHEAMGINFIDTYFRSGLYPAATNPFTPGNEGAGSVTAVGEGVQGFREGDRVAYLTTPGSYAEARNVPASAAVGLPASIGADQAAAMMLKGLTAEYLLHRTFKVEPGSTILVHAAAGGVGLILCQWGKRLGATVIGTVGSAEKADLARANGCDHTILYRDEDFAARVREITAGKLCDVVYDGIGKTTFPASLDCIRPLGTFVSFGNASGPIEAFNLGLLGPKGSLFVTRPTLFTFIADRGRYGEMAARLFDVVSSGAVNIPITRRWRLEEAVQAHVALEARETTGSMILVP